MFTYTIGKWTLICEINATEYKITFHNTEDIAE